MWMLEPGPEKRLAARSSRVKDGGREGQAGPGGGQEGGLEGHA
eukprot:CAMPEP_0185502318 /NCGR_PEP_ID=MMETSP1366-20130426/28470_1 /TAXON_ID=38817 /ORGANISM="Gephyrocapsa oceanica, Strain RCC1303" /LENGTH=42 /DNA_ID= /DNA_START= /DNA_END= /DNA_ORIENTATION=